MAEKKIKTRVQSKHDIEANWKQALNFIPLAGEVIVYDPDSTYKAPRIKVGDGVTKVNDLSFMDANSYVMSSGVSDPSASTTGQYYFKYSS